jgi:hypothetical protein
MHDRDIALQHDFIERTLAAIPSEMATISVNHYVGILHAQIEAPAAEGWQLQFRFDDPYCAYFGTHPSSWRLMLGDALLQRIKNLPAATVSVDDQPPVKLSTADLASQIKIQIPAGMGVHTWKLRPAR